MKIAATIGTGLALAGASSIPAAAPEVPSLRERRDAIAKQLVKERKQHRADRRRLVQIIHRRTTVPQAIDLAAFTYGVNRWRMRRIAFCESRFNPQARNGRSKASGVFQFLDSTWRRNHYGRAGFSVWNPMANALGAAHHMSRYGFSAWVCR